MRVGSLFSGIGGLELGLERAGMTVAWQVEVDEFCRRVLAKHWPDVPKHGDITEITGEELELVDLICGGFPCQPVSVAGQRKGTEDERWLWPEFARIVRVVRPRWVLVENVPNLLSVNDGRAMGGFSGTWPRRGMMRSGSAFALPMLERPISGSGCLLWATPAAADAVGSHGGGQGRSLRTDMHNLKRGLWPTPQAHDCHKGDPKRVGRYGTKHGGRNLNDEVLLWPTPKNRDFRSPRGGAGERRDSPDLNVRTYVEDGKPAQGQLNPAWVEMLQGFPPGWTDIDGPPALAKCSTNGSRRD